MTDKQHDAIAKWERRWLAGSGLMSLVFMGFIAYSLVVEGSHIAQTSSRADPQVLLSTDSFANPQVVQLSEDEFQATVVGQMFSFFPGDIRVPVGANVKFFLTARDVLHGFQVENTSINVELIPGEVSYLEYTFDKPGEYRVTCNEYCGISHQNMIGKVTVLSREDYAAENAPIAAVDGVEASSSEDGESSGEAPANTANDGEASILVNKAAYDANCMACHQATGAGVPSAFPPLNGHAVDLYRADRDYLAEVILYGVQGQITANGSKYNGMMPAWQHLSDEHIAGILNYILSSWDNADSDFTAYTLEDIAALRGQGLQAIDIYQQRKALELP